MRIKSTKHFTHQQVCRQLHNNGMKKKCVFYFLIFSTVYILTLFTYFTLFSGHRCDTEDINNGFPLRRVVQSWDSTDYDIYNSELINSMTDDVGNESEFDSLRSFTDPSLNWCQEYYFNSTCQKGFTRQVPTAVNIGMMKSGRNIFRIIY